MQTQQVLRVSALESAPPGIAGRVATNIAPGEQLAPQPTLRAVADIRSLPHASPYSGVWGRARA